MYGHKEKYRFLLVDDQELMLNLFKGILKAGGYKKFVYATTCKQALSIIKKHSIDMIIADMIMPNMNGVEFLKLIRSNPLYCDIPFVMVTGDVSKEGIVYAMEEGVDDYLIKPVSANKAMETIERIFNERRRSDSIRHESTNVFRLMHLKKYDEAIALAHQKVKISKNIELYLVLSECYLEVSDFDNAIKYAQKVLDIKNDSRAVFLLGKIYMADMDYERAIKKFNESSNMNPMNTGRKVEIASAYLKSGLIHEAEEIFEFLRKSDITDLDCVGIGSAYLVSGNLEKAGAYLDKVVDPIPEMVSVFSKYAVALRKVKKYEECMKQYEICLKIEPENPSILFGLGCMHFVERDVDAAIKMVEKAIALKPSFVDAKKMLAYMKLKRENLL